MRRTRVSVKCTAGQLIKAKLDIVLGNDITTPVAIHEFKKAGFTDVFDKDRVTIVLDHFVPNKDIKAAEQSKTCREFACSHCVSHFYDVGKMGIEHALLPEQGIVTARRLHYRRGQPHLHLRCAGRVLHRRWLYGYGSRHGNGHGVV